MTHSLYSHCRQKFCCLALLAAAFHTTVAVAHDHDPTTHEAVIEQIEAKLSELLEIKEIVPVEDTGFYRIRLFDGTLLYTDKEARGLAVGDIYSFSGEGFINQSETLLNEERFTAIKKLPQEDFVTFEAEGEKVGHIYVFTDVDCGYCRRLHSEIPYYQQNGVEVRYIAWPRCGTGPECRSYKVMQDIWCADNQQQAMTDAKQGKRISHTSCENPVAAQFALGSAFGLRGTPFILLSNGNAIPGYEPVENIIRQLQ